MQKDSEIHSEGTWQAFTHAAGSPEFLTPQPGPRDPGLPAARRLRRSRDNVQETCTLSSSRFRINCPQPKEEIC